MKLVTVVLSLILLSGCAARVVVPNDPGGHRAALCAEQADAEVPTTWMIVQEIADKSPHPRLTKMNFALALYWPLGIVSSFGMGWVAVQRGKHQHYQAAFDRCLAETMPGPKVEK